MIRKYAPVAFSLTMFGVIGFLVYMYYPENYFALRYQAAIDCRRIEAVRAIASLAERYHQKQGHYPLARDPAGAVVSVIITDKALPGSYRVNPPPEISGRLVPAERFRREVSRVLGVDIKLPYDPQTNFAWEKRFYLYKTMADGGYTVSGVLFSATGQTRKEAEHRHRYRIGSFASRTEGVYRYDAASVRPVTCGEP